MDFEINHLDEYTLVKLQVEHIDKDIINDILRGIKKELKSGAKNFIVDLETISEVDNTFYTVMDDIITAVLQKEGILVACSLQIGEIITRLENKGVICTPTLDEATDYVFMNEIEKDLLSDSGFEDDLNDY